ncbi:MAG: UDP-3-O-(3-hydroxymyristoyl)glucosamine N-acyltransferase, partial [Rikenellaceae bacterium]|nr:UDP-3-O-(3-hydroxymyristoyl)glucosamine N-acyltransferase [Rikenellaceae bacterium]
DSQAKVTTICKIEEGEPGALAFLSNPKYEPFIYGTKASVVIVNQDFRPNKEVPATLIKVQNAYGAFAKILELYQSMKPQKSGISELACIHASAGLEEEAYVGEFAVIGQDVKIGKNAKIYPQVYIGDRVVIGQGVTLYPGVRIYDECVLGDHVTLHAGVVIGADGFGFAPQPDGSYHKIPQIGNVVIEDEVEIGANTCIDRATMGSTVIKKGTKIDDLVMIAHNVQVGENSVFSAQVGIAGSTRIGRNCMFGGQVGIAGHISIAEGTQIASQSGVANSIKTPNQALMGTPAYDARSYQRAAIAFKSLPEALKKISSLEKELARLKENLSL